MIRWALVTTTAAAVFVATGWVMLRPSALHADVSQPEQDALDCRVTGRAILPRKLACPNDAVEVRFALDPVCGDGSDRGAIQHLLLRHDLPDGIVPFAGAEQTQAGPSQQNRWSMELSNEINAHVEVGHRVTALRPGVYDLGAATVEITDRQGKVWTSYLTPATLVVNPCGAVPERRPQALYLPLAMSPGCAPAARPTDLVLIVDRSASMGGGGLTGAIGRATRFVDQLDLTVDRMAVLGFDSQVEVLAPLTHDRAVVETALRTLTPRNGTRIDRALHAGVAHLEDGTPAGLRRRALILITDGVQIGPGGDTPVLDAAREARRHGVTVIAIGVGPAPNWPLLRAIADNPPEGVVGQDGSRLDDALHDAVATVRCAR
ncbi:MAG: VWA domain-containing protein [Ardenticatenales bacterium]|nr:VWA domain-containing protein [Ardenticatenales bacterium]